MPGYVTKALTRFWHPPPVKIQDQSYLSRTQKVYNQNLLCQEMSTRSGSNLVLRIPINFYSYTCNNVYYLIVSLMYKTFLFFNLLYQVISTRSGST